MITILIISTITFIILFIYQIFKFITIKIKTRNQIQKIKRQIRDFENNNRRSLDLTYNDNPLFNMVMLSNYEPRNSEHALETQAMIIPVPVYNNLQVKKYQNFSGRPVYYEQRPSCGLILDEEDERNNSNPSYVGLDVRPTVGARVDEISRI